MCYLPRFFTISFNQTVTFYAAHTLENKGRQIKGQILLSLYARTFLPFWITHISNTLLNKDKSTILNI